MKKQFRAMLHAFAVAACIASCDSQAPQSSKAKEATPPEKQSPAQASSPVNLKSETEGTRVTDAKPADGPLETLYEEKGRAPQNQNWTLESGYLAGDTLSLCRGNREGVVELWQFSKDESGWRLTAKGDLGSGSSLMSIRMIDENTVLFVRRNMKEDRLQLSERSIIDTPLYRAVLMNGQEFWPYTRAAGGAIATEDRKSELLPSLPVPPQSRGPSLVIAANDGGPTGTTKISFVGIVLWSALSMAAVILLGLWFSKHK